MINGTTVRNQIHSSQDGLTYAVQATIDDFINQIPGEQAFAVPGGTILEDHITELSMADDNMHTRSAVDLQLESGIDPFSERLLLGKILVFLKAPIMRAA